MARTGGYYLMAFPLSGYESGLIGTDPLAISGFL